MNIGIRQRRENPSMSLQTSAGNHCHVATHVPSRRLKSQDSSRVSRLPAMSRPTVPRGMLSDSRRPVVSRDSWRGRQPQDYQPDEANPKQREHGACPRGRGGLASMMDEDLAVCGDEHGGDDESSAGGGGGVEAGYKCSPTGPAARSARTSRSRSGEQILAFRGSCRQDFTKHGC